MARPTKYEPEMCQAVIEAGKEGKTLAEMATDIGIHRETLNEWRGANEEFSDAVKEGLANAQSWWEELMRHGASGVNPDVQPTLAIFNMKNRFRDDWSDRTQTEISGPKGGAIPVTEVVYKIIDPTRKD